MLHAVLDTSVLIAALRSRNGASFALLQRIGTPGWQLHISTALLLEYEEIARREAAALWARSERVEAILDFLAASGIEHHISFRVRPFLSDPDDDFVLELAVSAAARYIITFNLRNFTGSERFGVIALRPADFLAKLNTPAP